MIWHGLGSTGGAALSTTMQTQGGLAWAVIGCCFDLVMLLWVQGQQLAVLVILMLCPCYAQSVHIAMPTTCSMR
jgi:hypothetical protein